MKSEILSFFCVFILQKKTGCFIIIIIITSCFKHFCHILNLLGKKWMMALYDKHGKNAAGLHIHLIVSFFYVCHSDRTSFRNVCCIPNAGVLAVD